MRRTWAVVLLAAVSAAALTATEHPLAGSPGHASSIAVIEARCPTFSWRDLPGVERWRLAVYRVTEESTDAPGPGVLVLSERIPGGFFSWTPSLERCLERGRTYAWSIGAERRKGRPVWSEPRLFRVAKTRELEVEEVLEVLDPQSRNNEVTDPPSVPDPTRSHAMNAPGGSASPSGSTAGLGPSAPDAGTVLSLLGNLYLENGAGARVRMQSGAAAWDLVSTNLGFFVADAAGGGTQLSIFDGAPTGALEVRSNGISIANDLFCTDCIQSSDIENDSIQSADIAPGVLGASKLSTGAVGSAELSRIYSVSVECNGECDDSTPGEACDTLTTSVVPPIPDPEPIAVACADPEDYASSVDCGGDNFCRPGARITFDTLGFCADVTGYDLIVWCLARGDG